MRFGREVDHGVVTRKHGSEQWSVADITLDELEPRAIGDGLEVGQVPGVRQLVQDGHAGVAGSWVAAAY